MATATRGGQHISCGKRGSTSYETLNLNFKQGMVENIDEESRQYFSIWLIMWSSAIFSVFARSSLTRCVLQRAASTLLAERVRAASLAA